MQYKIILSDIFFIALIGALFFTAFIGGYHFIIPDEGRYVEVAREMLASHQFITPHLNGTAFLDKPILYYWCQCFLIKTFGLHEWSVRLLPAFFGLLGCMLIYIAGYTLYNRRTGWIAALVLMSSFLYFASSHYANMDLMLAVLLSGAFWCFIIAMKTSHRYRYVLFLSAYFFAALAFLTKGLMGIFLPGMVIFLWILCLWCWRTLLEINLTSGLLLFLAIVLPWFVLVQKENPEFLNYFFIVQQFSRYTAVEFNAHQPMYFYALIVLCGLFPWTLFLFQAGRSLVETLKCRWKNADVELFLALWVVVIFIFFSIPKSKIVGYILPIFPALAMIIAIYLEKNWQQLPQSKHLKKVSIIFFGISLFAFFALLIIPRKLALTNDSGNHYLLGIGFILLCGSGITVFCSFYQKQFMATFVAILLTLAAVEVTAIASGGTMKKLTTTKLFALYIKQHAPADAMVATYHNYYQDLPVYLEHQVYVAYDWNSSKVSEDNWRRELATDIIYKHQRQKYLIDHQQFLALWKSHDLYVVLDNKNLNNLRLLVSSPVNILMQDGKLVLVNNQGDRT